MDTSAKAKRATSRALRHLRLRCPTGTSLCDALTAELAWVYRHERNDRQTDLRENQ